VVKPEAAGQIRDHISWVNKTTREDLMLRVTFTTVHGKKHTFFRLTCENAINSAILLCESNGRLHVAPTLRWSSDQLSREDGNALPGSGCVGLFCAF